MAALSHLKFAARLLLKQPGFSIVAALILALGIGATSAVFSMIQGVLLTPPPYRHRNSSCSSNPRVPTGRRWTVLAAGLHSSGSNGKSNRRPARIAAYGWTFNFLIRSEGSESMRAWRSPRLFATVGPHTVIGRGFVGRFWKRSDEGNPARVRVLAARLRWRRRHHRQDGSHQPL